MMRRYRTPLLLILLALAAALALAGCTGLDDTILGEWTREDVHGEQRTIEFGEDGAFIVDGDVTGEYTLLDEDRVEVITPDEARIFNFEVEGDTLTLVDGADTSTWERVEE